MKKADKTKKGQKTGQETARVTELTEQELKQVQGGREHDRHRVPDLRSGADPVW